MIVLWVIGWGLGFGGIMEIVDPDGKVQDIWPMVLAIPGLIGGVIFSAAFITAERSRRFDQVPLTRYGLWGALTGLVLGILSIPAEVGDVSPGAAGMIGLGIVLGTIAAFGIWLFFRLFSRWTSNPA